jgi:hypothetical protein
LNKEDLSVFVTSWAEQSHTQDFLSDHLMLEHDIFSYEKMDFPMALLQSKGTWARGHNSLK